MDQSIGRKVFKRRNRLPDARRESQPDPRGTQQSSLRKIYTALNAVEAEQALVDFAEQWDNLYPTISKSWLSHWTQVIPFFAFPLDIRKAIYTTNAIESLNMTLRMVLRNHRSFPSDDSALKVVFLAINNIAKKWTMPIKDWKAALNRFAIEFGDRFPL
ncbi:MAG: hypothetical protein DCF20_02565 [Pseudanabaena sp.]|nr:MAG: hypothetical protein DCF20_02565 [Pseudanabaena sp.]